MSGTARPDSTLSWRTPTGRWRWLILGALGVAPYACGGRTDAAGELEGEPDPRGNGQGSSPGTPIPTTGGTGGNAGVSGSGGIGGTSGTAGTSGAGGTVGTRSTCEPPITVLGGGWERCANGMLHRSSVGACESALPRPERVREPNGNPVPDAGVNGYSIYSCHEDAECDAAPHGHCEIDPYQGGTYCHYGCITDSDCTPGYVCTCGDAIGECVAATCSTDAECGRGLLCSDYVSNPGCGGMAFACQLPSDSCAAQSDCNPGLYCSRGYTDSLDATPTPRSCIAPGCDIGRPFLVDGRERRASEVARADWYPARPSSEETVVAMGPELRAAIARAGPTRR